MARTNPARIFLYVVATIITLIVVGRIVYLNFESDLQDWILQQSVPKGRFADATSPSEPDYDDPGSWAALPEAPGEAAAVPSGFQPQPSPDADVFFVHPTSYLGTDYWNAPIDEPGAQNAVVTSYLRNMASAFADAGDIYAPFYRQAAFGAFFDTSGDGVQALLLAYSDVLRAFDHFIANRDQSRPFILAGHSQGSLHSLFLLRDRIAGQPIAQQMVASYIIGWPVSVEADIGPLVGLEICTTAQQTGCVISYQTIAPKGDMAGLRATFMDAPSLFGQPKLETTMLCTNPLNWQAAGPTVAKAENPGSIEFAARETPIGELIPGLVGAGCHETGFLALTNLPGDAFTSYVLPGGNYHAYDLPLFYAALRQNAHARATAFIGQSN